MDIAQECGLLTPYDIPQGTIRAMAEHGHVEVGYVDEITTRMPSPDEARKLNLGAGAPVMVYVRTTYSKRATVAPHPDDLRWRPEPRRLRTGRSRRVPRKAGRFVIVEPAGVGDLPTRITMRHEAGEWLAARGINQWQKPWPTDEAMIDRLPASIHAGETWMVRHQDGSTAATVTLDTYADPAVLDAARAT